MLCYWNCIAFKNILLHRAWTQYVTNLHLSIPINYVRPYEDDDLMLKLTSMIADLNNDYRYPMIRRSPNF